MSAKRKRAERGSSWWALANSPIIILIVSGILIGGGAKLYSDHQEVIDDQVARRSTLSNLLVEYRQRISALENLDSELNEYLGPGPGVADPNVPFTDVERAAFERLSFRIGLSQEEVLRGSGSYVPTSPSFANVNMQVIASQIEDSAGIPNLQAGAIQLLGVLNSDPSILWIFVRAHLPSMREFYIGRHFMTLNGELPLARGGKLTVPQEMRLGIPQLRSGDLQKVKEESDARHLKLQEVLRKLEIQR